MKTISFLFLFCSVLLYPQKFHSLDGIENQQGETILLYRSGQNYFFYNPVIKFNTSTLSEQIVMTAFYNYSPPSEQARAIYDFEFFPGNENNFVNTGFVIDPDNHNFIARNDTAVAWDIGGDFRRIDISKQNPQKVYAFSGVTARSFDGGYTYPPDSIFLNAGFAALSVSDYDDNIFFGVDEELRFARNGGVVDTSLVFVDRYFNIFYDINNLHIYRLNKTYGSYTFNVSDNKGDPFTWTKSYQSENPLYMTSDDQTSGEVYLSETNIIYRSVDHGYSFNPYKTLPYSINGLYKKPGSNILYASTSYKIYKITPDTIDVIKSLPVPQDNFDWFPLAVGNRWIYDITLLDGNCFLPDSTFIEYSEIEKDTLISGKKYFKFSPRLAYRFYYMRIDSAEGKLMTLNLPDLTEEIVYDFLMEPGDSIINNPQYPVQGYHLLKEDTLFLFGTNRLRRILQTLSFVPPSYVLIKGIGFYEDSFCEFGGFERNLKGCIINGIVYGDTTLTDVNDYLNEVPAEFSIYQNYPNPFNPSTTIKYSIPRQSYVIIKIFDALGNEIAGLVNEEKPAGNYSVDFSAKNLSSGIYFYRINAGEFTETKKMILMK